MAHPRLPPALLEQAKALFISGRVPTVPTAITAAGIDPHHRRTVFRRAKVQDWLSARAANLSAAVAPLAVPPSAAAVALVAFDAETARQRLRASAALRADGFKAAVDRVAGVSFSDAKTISDPQNNVNLDPETLNILSQIDTRASEHAANLLGMNQKQTATAVNVQVQIADHFNAIKRAVDAGEITDDDIPDPATLTLEDDAPREALQEPVIQPVAVEPAKVHETQDEKS